jgi:hypothetical protein
VNFVKDQIVRQRRRENVREWLPGSGRAAGKEKAADQQSHALLFMLTDSVPVLS